MGNPQREAVLAINTVGKDKAPRSRGARQGRAVLMAEAVGVWTESWLEAKCELAGEQLGSRDRLVQHSQYAPVGCNSEVTLDYSLHVTM